MEPNHSALAFILKKHGYVLNRKIGHGANGTCYMVFSEKYQTAFLCKAIQLLYGSEKSRMEQYNREIQSLSLLCHKNIVKIYDFFADSEWLFMIMEYCQNGSLQQYIQNISSKVQFVDYNFTRKVLSDILAALQYCHEIKRISHHDIKPGNVVLDVYGNAKLCDFGFSAIMEATTARDSDSDQESSAQPTDSIKASGSLYFMSPQLLNFCLKRTKDYDMFAADIWATGVTAYFLITGQVPFLGHTKMDVLSSQMKAFSSDACGSHSDIFARLPPSLPEDLLTILKLSLQYNEKGRATASQLIQILNNSMNQESLPTLIKINHSGLKSGSYDCSTSAPKLHHRATGKNSKRRLSCSTSAGLIKKPICPLVRRISMKKIL